MLWLDWKRRKKIAMRSITGSDATVDDGDLMNHYRMLVSHLEFLFIKSCKQIDPSILDSNEFIGSVLKKGNIAFFSNVKVIV